MANATTNLGTPVFGKEGFRAHLPVNGGSHIYGRTLVAQNAEGNLVPGSTASSGVAIGIAEHEADNSAGADGDKRCMVESDRVYGLLNGSGGDACSEATPQNSVVYMVDDHTVADNDSSGTRKAAGLFRGMEPDGRVRVLVNSEMVVLVLGLVSPA